jgi:hypothetical protein
MTNDIKLINAVLDTVSQESHIQRLKIYTYKVRKNSSNVIYIPNQTTERPDLIQATRALHSGDERQTLCSLQIEQEWSG